MFNPVVTAEIRWLYRHRRDRGAGRHRRELGPGHQREGSIEDTALKTNARPPKDRRQLRLRDLAGLIVIDFIDMEERKNNAAVEKRFGTS